MQSMLKFSEKLHVFGQNIQLSSVLQNIKQRLEKMHRWNKINFQVTLYTHAYIDLNIFQIKIMF